MHRARCYAQRGAAKKRAAGQLLASVECVGWAGSKAPRRPKPQQRRGAERKAKGLWREGLCWRRRSQPTYAHM